MKKITYTFFVIFLAFSLIGCGPTQQELQEYSAQTQTAMVPTSTPTPEPTETPSLIYGIDSPIEVNGTSFLISEVIVTVGTLSVILQVSDGDIGDISGLIFAGAKIKCDNFDDNAATLQQRDNELRANFSVPSNTVYEKCTFNFRDYSIELATFFD